MWATITPAIGLLFGVTPGACVIFTLSPLTNGPAINPLTESRMNIRGAASQLSLAINSKNPLGFDPLEELLPAFGTLRPAGFVPGTHVTSGTTVSSTVTVAVQEFEAPLSSVTVRVTVVTPSG